MRELFRAWCDELGKDPMSESVLEEWSKLLAEWCTQNDRNPTIAWHQLQWANERKHAFDLKYSSSRVEPSKYDAFMIKTGNACAEKKNLADARLAYVYALQIKKEKLALAERWKTLAALGDVEYNAKNYARSASYYGKAGLWTIDEKASYAADTVQRSKQYKSAADAYRSLLKRGPCSVARRGFSAKTTSAGDYNLDTELTRYDALVQSGSYKEIAIVWYTIGTSAFNKLLLHDAKAAFTLAFEGLRASSSYRSPFNELLGDVAYAEHEFETAANYYNAGSLQFSGKRQEITKLQRTARTADNFKVVADKFRDLYNKSDLHRL